MAVLNREANIVLTTGQEIAILAIDDRLGELEKVAARTEDVENLIQIISENAGPITAAREVVRYLEGEEG